MNPIFIPEFTQIGGDISLVSASQVPMRLPQLRDSVKGLSQEGWFWFSAVVPCNPILAWTSLHMSGSDEYQEARNLSRAMDHEHTFIAERRETHHGCPSNLEAFRSYKKVGSLILALGMVQHSLD
jgi:hypothetical protein